MVLLHSLVTVSSKRDIRIFGVIYKQIVKPSTESILETNSRSGTGVDGEVDIMTDLTWVSHQNIPKHCVNTVLKFCDSGVTFI